MRRVRRLVIGLLVVGAVSGSRAQGDWVILDGIDVTGNVKTNREVVLRELPFRIGDTLLLDMLPERLLEGEQAVMNTGLFSTAAITYQNWKGSEQRMVLRVEVTEGWYIYPVPLFELADRNFNVWWTEQNRSLQRINFGLAFLHLNFTGWRDKLSLKVKYGYTRNYSFSYSYPYLNRQRTLGISTDFGYRRNREVNYLSNGNRQEFYRDEDKFVYTRLGGALGLHWRPRQYASHNVYLGYHRNHIDSVIARELNPDFFLHGREYQRFFDLTYSFDYDKRDIRAYAWKGYRIGGKLQKDGLGIYGDRNGLTAEFWYEKYLPLGSRWSLATQARAKYSLIRKRQPFNDYQAFGFGQNTLPGYEYYVIDGQDMALLKSSMRFRFFDGKITFGRYLPESFRKMPLRMAFALHGGTAYVADPFTGSRSVLANRLLGSVGVGLDIVLYYDKVFQVQYSMNHLGERGLYLSFDSNL